MNNINNINKMKTPKITWAQNDEYILLDIHLEKNDNNIKINENNISFEQGDYSCNLNLFNNIIVDESKYSQKRIYEFKLKKQNTDEWTQLLLNKNDYKANISVNWDKWDEEIDEEQDNMMGGMPGMEQMMGGMPGMEQMMGGMPGMEQMMGGMYNNQCMPCSNTKNENDGDEDDEDEDDENEDEDDENEAVDEDEDDNENKAEAVDEDEDDNENKAEEVDEDEELNESSDSSDSSDKSLKTHNWDEYKNKGLI